MCSICNISKNRYTTSTKMYNESNITSCKTVLKHVSKIDVNWEIFKNTHPFFLIFFLMYFTFVIICNAILIQQTLIYMHTVLLLKRIDVDRPITQFTNPCLQLSPFYRVIFPLQQIY